MSDATKDKPKGFVNLGDIDWSSGDETADTIYMQWNEGWGIWEQVIDEARGVSRVVEWTRAATSAARIASLEAEVERLNQALDDIAEHRKPDYRPDGTRWWDNGGEGFMEWAIEHARQALTEPRT